MRVNVIKKRLPRDLWSIWAGRGSPGPLTCIAIGVLGHGTRVGANLPEDNDVFIIFFTVKRYFLMPIYNR